MPIASCGEKKKKSIYTALKYDAKPNLTFSLILKLILTLSTVLYRWLHTVFSACLPLQCFVNCSYLIALSTDEEYEKNKFILVIFYML